MSVDLQACRVLRALPFQGRLEILRAVSKAVDREFPERNRTALVKRFVRTKVVRNAVRGVSR